MRIQSEYLKGGKCEEIMDKLSKIISGDGSITRKFVVNLNQVWQLRWLGRLQRVREE